MIIFEGRNSELIVVMIKTKIEAKLNIVSVKYENLTSNLKSGDLIASIEIKINWAVIKDQITEKSIITDVLYILISFNFFAITLLKRMFSNFVFIFLITLTAMRIPTFKY